MARHKASEITRAALLRAIGDGKTFGEICVTWPTRAWERAIDGALQREKRAGMIRFGGGRRWELTEAGRKDVANG